MHAVRRKFPGPDVGSTLGRRQTVKAAAFEAAMCRFESCRPNHFKRSIAWVQPTGGVVANQKQGVLIEVSE